MTDIELLTALIVGEAGSEPLEGQIGSPNRLRFTAPIMCLCGSTRFKAAFQDWNERLTAQGTIVLSVAFYVHSEERVTTPEEKQRLDELHKRKIDLADDVFVLDVGGYIGDSTRSEIEYAIAMEKPVRYLSAVCPEYVMPKSLEERLADLVEYIRAYTKYVRFHWELDNDDPGGDAQNNPVLLSLYEEMVRAMNDLPAATREKLNNGGGQ